MRGATGRHCPPWRASRHGWSRLPPPISQRWHSRALEGGIEKPARGGGAARAGGGASRGLRALAAAALPEGCERRKSSCRLGASCGGKPEARAFPRSRSGGVRLAGGPHRLSLGGDLALQQESGAALAALQEWLLGEHRAGRAILSRGDWSLADDEAAAAVEWQGQPYLLVAPAGMNRSSANPFGELIVQDPRQREPSVPGLNERPLMRLLEAFERLAAGESPRELRPGGQAHARDFGRSGLRQIAPDRAAFPRAARARHAGVRAAVSKRGHAFPLAPAGDRTRAAFPRPAHPRRARPGGAGAARLPRPLRPRASAGRSGGRARASAGDGDPGGERACCEATRSAPFAAGKIRGRNGWCKTGRCWSRFLQEALARRGVELDKPAAWLRVLRSYAFAPNDLALRRACLDWLEGEPLDAADAERIGLRADDAAAEASPAEVNALCRSAAGGAVPALVLVPAIRLLLRPDGGLWPSADARALLWHGGRHAGARGARGA